MNFTLWARPKAQMKSLQQSERWQLMSALSDSSVATFSLPFFRWFFLFPPTFPKLRIVLHKTTCRFSSTDGLLLFVLLDDEKVQEDIT